MKARDLIEPIAADVRAMASQAEADRQLPAELMTRLVDAGLFSVYTPRQFGGLELPLPEAQRVVEHLARIDGSVGWVVALGMHNAIFVAALPEESASAIFRNGSALLAGGPGPTVAAVPVEGGYRLTGQWAFVSGAPNADWILVAAPIADGSPIGPEGPRMISAAMPARDVQVLDTWHTTGLRGTGSHEVRVDDLFVPEAMTSSISMATGLPAVRESPFTRIPFITALTIGLVPAVSLGVARHAIEEFRLIACGKQRGPGVTLSDTVQAQAGLAKAEALLRSARAYWYETVECLWRRVESGGEVTIEDQVAVRLAALTVAENCVSAVDTVVRQAGTSAIFQASPLERCWRDIHTVSQHMHVQDARWETCGRVLFGKEAGGPII